jgi:NitT/TauT family transport system permease protein
MESPVIEMPRTTSAPVAPPATLDATPALGTGKSSWAAALIPFLPAVAAAIALTIHRALPNGQNAEPTRLYPRLLIGVIVASVLLGFTRKLWRPIKPNWRTFPLAAPVNTIAWCVRSAPILAAGVILLCAWDLITLKFNLMPLPYFPGPDGVLQTLVDDWAGTGAGQPGLAECMAHSLILLGGGYLTGSLLGIICGVVIGWFAPARYWGMPIMKIVGPIPATALIPMALMLFPSPLMSAVSLIALAVWFPVTMLTLSGVSNTRASLLDVAKTLGAGPGFLVFRVAIPAAMPSIFVGLFMGLGASFLTLIVAEAVGVQAGLGWYIDWARAYSDYKKVYAALIIMSVFFSTIMTLLFKLRDYVLVWQKGTIKW